MNAQSKEILSSLTSASMDSVTDITVSTYVRAAVLLSGP